MEKRYWLLLVIKDRIQPIQIQNTLFKFTMESGVSEDEAFKFDPYTWGPRSIDIYDALGELQNEGMVDVELSPRGWDVCRPTDKGERAIEELKGQAPPELVSKLYEMLDWVKSRDLQPLLRDVYRDYKEYATETLFIE